jgi:hypothetical protein
MIREVVREWKSGRDRGDTNVLIQMLEEEVEHLLGRRNSRRTDRIEDEEDDRRRRPH